MCMRRWLVALPLLSLVAVAAAQSSSPPDPSAAFEVVVNTAIGYVLAALTAVAVLFALVLGIRFFMNLSRRAIGR